MRLRWDKRARTGFVVCLSLLAVAVAFLLPPLRQAPQYHRFADHRAWAGCPNVLNVISNLALVTVGLVGLAFCLSRRPGGGRPFLEPSERWPYALCFLGTFLTGLGSGYYHWAPDDATLVWDRLPMTTVFMSFLAATIMERMSVAAGVRLLLPLVLAGAASVFYWAWTGNLWPYAAVQFYGLALVGLLLWLFPARYTRTADLLWALAFYGLAKASEVLDGAIYNLGHILSGHTLKHLLAALVMGGLLWMLARRQPQPASSCA